MSNSWFKRLATMVQGDGLRAQLVRGGLGSLAIKAGQALLAFAVAVVLARTLGPEGYGVYSFALAILMLTAIPAQVGIPQLVVRETAKAQANEDWGLIRGLWHWATVTVAIFSSVALVIVGVIIFWVSLDGDSDRTNTLIIGMALIPLVAFTNAGDACLRGLRKVVQGQLAESIVRPLVLILIVVIWLNVSDQVASLTAEQVMMFYVASSLVALTMARWLLKQSKPKYLREAHGSEFQTKYWWKAVVPLALIASLHLINNYADLIILGVFQPNDDVGIYRAASQLSLLIIFGLQAINQVLHPHFSRLYATGDKHRLQRLVTISSRLILGLAILPFLAFMFAGEYILNLIFGSEYSIGATALVILALGQLANAAFGSVGALLNMTGHEGDTMRGMMIAIVVNVVLNFVLIPMYGMIGAAIATAISYFLWNAVLRFYVHKRLAIESSAFSFRNG